jgi:hypothetical protein
MAAQASAPLDLETLQAAASQDADSRKRTWFFQGMGLAALMLLGVYSAGGLAHHHGSEDTSGHDSAVAFHPGVSGIKTRGGFRSATRDPVPVAMNGGQGFGGAETDLEQQVFAYDSNGPQFKQQALSKADVVSKLISNSGDRSMSMLATTAMIRRGPQPACERVRDHAGRGQEEGGDDVGRGIGKGKKPTGRYRAT